MDWFGGIVEIKLDVAGELVRFEKRLSLFAQSQLPYATGMALTSIARKVAAAETLGLREKLEHPRPFTLNGMAVQPARKDNLTAVVFMKDIQARYLAPSEIGAKQVVAKTSVLTPKDIALNSYGNIPKGALSRLKGNPNVFIGSVVTKSGEKIGGVWQRVGGGSIATRNKRGYRKGERIARTAADKGALKLLIRFTAPIQLKAKLDYRKRAVTMITAIYEHELATALARALSTAR